MGFGAQCVSSRIKPCRPPSRAVGIWGGPSIEPSIGEGVNPGNHTSLFALVFTNALCVSRTKRKCTIVGQVDEDVANSVFLPPAIFFLQPSSHPVIQFCVPTFTVVSLNLQLCSCKVTEV